MISLIAYAAIGGAACRSETYDEATCLRHSEPTGAPCEWCHCHPPSGDVDPACFSPAEANALPAYCACAERAQPPIVANPPKWSWATLGDMAFAHSGQATLYTPEDLALLKRYSMVQFDKKENAAAQPNASALDRFIAAARQVRSVNPEVQILAYLNGLIDFPAFTRLHAAAQADAALRLPANITIRGNRVFDQRNPKMRDAFLASVRYAMSSGVFNGVFIDRANWAEKCAPSWGTPTCVALAAAQRVLLAEISDALGDGNITLAKETSNAPALDWEVANAAMTSDTFCSAYCHGCNASVDPAALWSKADATACAASITTVASAATRTQLTQSHAMGPFVGALSAQAREFTIAAFLIGAGAHSYFTYANWAASCWELAGTKWWPEYGYPLGAPTTPANRKINNRSTYKYSRNFTSGTTVWVDVYTREAEIRWGGKPSAWHAAT